MEALLLLDDMDGVDRHVNSQPSTFIWHSQKEQCRLELYLLDKNTDSLCWNRTMGALCDGFSAVLVGSVHQ